MTVKGPQRVIPRPSERHRRVARRASDITIVDDPNDVEIIDSDAASKGASIFVTIGILGVLASTIGFFFLGFTGRAETSIGIVFIPVAGVVGYASIRRWVVTSPKEEWLGALVFAGLGLRLLAAVPRLLGGADAPLYQLTGVRISESLRDLDFAVDTGRAIPGTGAVRYLSGIVNVFTGSNYLATFVVFLAFALIGQVAFLKGVRGTLTPRQFRLFALLMMFSPTLAFWPSSIGKESVVLFGTGLIALGASRLYNRAWNGVAPVLFGIFSIGMVRPHVAIVILIGMSIGLLARRAHTKGRMMSHLLVLTVVIVGSMWAAGAAAQLVGLESLDGLSDISAALDFTEERTSQDNSQFTAPRVDSFASYPWAFVTVLFRPFPWEAGSPIALLSAVEGVALMLLALRALPGAFVYLGDLMQRGQMLFAAAYTAIFVFLFSAIGNFGILSRQRAQVIPFVLLLIAFGIAAEARQVRRSGT